LTDLQNNKARQYAIKLLSYRGRSEKELEERLRKKGISEAVIHNTIRYLKDSGLVDDVSLAETLKREAFSTKMYSQYAARRFLLQRGIPHDITDAVFHNDGNDDIANARRLADKKLRTLSNYPAMTAKRRLYYLLSRRGFSPEIIRTVCNEIQFQKEEEQ
jgi:regulatory protein